MASYQVLPASTVFEDLGSGLGKYLGESYSGKKKKKDKELRNEKINEYSEAMEDDYDKEITGFDKNGDPVYKMKKKESPLSKDPARILKDALLFDENIPEIGEKIGLTEKAQGFPVAGGGAALPGPGGGEYLPGTIQDIKTPGFADIVRDSLLERAAPGMDPGEATRKMFGTNVSGKEELPEGFIEEIDSIFSEEETPEEPYSNKLKALIPKYADNKKAIDRIKLLLSLYPEV